MDFLNMKTKQCKEESENLQKIIAKLLTFYQLLDLYGKILKVWIELTEKISNTIMFHIVAEYPNVNATDLQNDSDFIVSSRMKIEEWVKEFVETVNQLNETIEQVKRKKQEVDLHLVEIEELKTNLSKNS